ncbi:MAG: signal peptide peptidase SppA, partial [Candidatus Margulisiibacteriota bacterium]
LNLLAFILDYALLFPSDAKNLQRFEAGVRFLPEKKRSFALIKPKEFVAVEIGGVIKGGQTEYSLLGGVRPGLDSILERIRAAAKDKLADGILLRIKGFEGGLGGMAVVQEIRSELLRAKEKGKKIIAYVEGSALGDEYYLASVADKIVAAPGSAIGGFGKSLALYRASGFFEKLGVEWQLFAKGKYKTAFDWLAPAASREQREMIEGLVANLYRQMLTDIAESRKIDIEKIKEIGDGMIFPAKLAQQMGLIDKVGYLSDVCLLGAELFGVSGEAKIIEPDLVEPEDVFFTQVFGVAIIEINGEIISGASGQNIIFGGTYTGSDKIVADIKKAADDVLVKAIVLRIDSPGGSAIAAGEIYRALDYARKKNKVIVASLGSLGASGAYYVAAGADKIVANRSTITGSIGVLGALPIFSELMKNLNVKTEVVKEGSHADMFSGLRKLTSPEVMALNRLLDETYQEFISVVAKGRKMSTSEVASVAEGKVYTGSQALELKLVDKIGGFSEAIDLAKEEAKIIGEPRLIYYREAPPFLQIGGAVTSALGLPPWIK